MKMENNQIPTIKPNKLTKLDWYLMFAWLLILIAVILVSVYLTINRINSCTSDPFGFGINTIKEKLDVDLVYGTVYYGKAKQNGMATGRTDFGDVNISDQLG